MAYLWKASSQRLYRATTLSLREVDVMVSLLRIGILYWGGDESFLLVTQRSARKLWISTLTLNKSDLRPVRWTMEPCNQRHIFTVIVNVIAFFPTRKKACSIIIMQIEFWHPLVYFFCGPGKCWTPCTNALKIEIWLLLDNI